MKHKEHRKNAESISEPALGAFVETYESVKNKIEYEFEAAGGVTGYVLVQVSDHVSKRGSGLNN